MDNSHKFHASIQNLLGTPVSKPKMCTIKLLHVIHSYAHLYNIPLSTINLPGISSE